MSVDLAVITLCRQGAGVAARIAAALPGAGVFVHEQAGRVPGATGFGSVMELTAGLFSRVRGLVYVLPAGVAVRAVAPHVRDKHADPAVVVVDVGARHAVSLLCGHEGGANDLAYAVANAVGAVPVVSTTTEAARDLVVGVGCRRGIAAAAVRAAVERALQSVDAGLERVRHLASAAIKREEAGLLAAAADMGRPLLFIPAGRIRACAREFTRSPLAQEKVDLPAVAEPCALLAGHDTELICRRMALRGVTVAVAREGCSS